MPPEVNPIAKATLKQESANMAILDANLSQYLAAAAAVVSLASPAHGAALAVGAAMMGVCGNYRQAVANDPPRDDFDQIQVSQARLNEALLPADEPQRSLHLFAAHQMLIADAFYGLLRSLERHDGAMAAGAVDAAAMQADAARQNADMAVAAHGSVAALVPVLNDSVGSLMGDAEQAFSQLSLDQVQQGYRDALGEPPANPGAPLAEVANSIDGTRDDLLEPFDPVAAHPILSAKELPPAREVLIEESYSEGLARISSALEGLVVEG